MIYAIVKDNIIINTIEWDGVSPWTPPENTEVFPLSVPAAIGWAWVNNAPVAPTSIPLTLKQQATAALRQGVTIQSVANPEINGSYACDLDAQQKLISSMLYVSTNNKFPGSSGKLPWYDLVGNAHIFDSTALFTLFANAILDYTTTLAEISAGTQTTMPASTVTIS